MESAEDRIADREGGTEGRKMTLNECRAHLMTGGIVRCSGWMKDILLKWDHGKGWMASANRGETWTTETGMLLAPTELFAEDWELA